MGFRRVSRFPRSSPASPWARRSLQSRLSFLLVAALIVGVAGASTSVDALANASVRAAGNLDQALAAYRRAAELPPTAGAGAYNVGTVLAQKDEIDEAFEVLRRLKQSGGFNTTSAGVDPNAANLRDDPRFAEIFPSETEFADSFVEAALSDVTGADAGAAFVFSGEDGSLLLSRRGEAAGDNFGSAVGGASDRDPRLFVIGAGNASEGRRGKAYVYEGLEEEPEFVIEPDENSVNLGQMFVSIVGDVDGDGHDDIVVGAWQHASAAPSGGKVYLYSGAVGTTLRTFTGKVMGETFGFDATGMGDVNGDDAIDFLITSAWSSVNGPQSGRVFILSGRQ